MSQVAQITVTLPAAPAQTVPQKERALDVQGATGSPSTLPVDGTSIQIEAALDGTVTVSVREVPSRGRVSEPCTKEFVPADYVQANSADPAGFAVAVTGIKEVPEVAPEVPAVVPVA